MKSVIVATTIGTIVIAYLVWSTFSGSWMDTPMGIRTRTTHISCPDEKRFYASLTPQNRRLRPSTRVYYAVNDPRIPGRIRDKVYPAFQKALADFPLHFPKTHPQPVLQFASGDTEGGMPHTLGNRVIVPLRESLADESPSSLWTTMIHELCHIHQRQDPSRWTELYEQLGFQKIADPIPVSLRGDDVVANPDAGSSGMPQIGWWSYKGQVGVLVFSTNPSTIRDHKSVVFPITPEGASSGVNQLREAFGKWSSQYDHPNEVTACMIADHWDTVVRPEDNPVEGTLGIVRRWLRKSNPTIQ